MRFISTIVGLLVISPAGCWSMDRDSENVLSIEVGRLGSVEVGALTPSKKFLLMRSQEMECPGIEVNAGRVSIVPSKAVGYYWDSEGRRNEIAAFREVGRYIIYVSDNLETEFENSFTISREYSVKEPIASASAEFLGACKRKSEYSGGRK